MSRKQKKELIKVIIAAVATCASAVCFSLCDLPGKLWFAELFVWVIIYLFIGFEYIIKALKNIVTGRLLDENFLMTVATVGAFIIGEYTEAVAVMLFYSIGELFQSYAVGKSRKSIASLMEMKAEFARVEREGKLTEVDPREVRVGEVITVKPGEKIALDGVVVTGNADINAAYITGESVPVPVAPGERVVSGTVNLDGLITVRVEKEYDDSTVAKVLELVETSSMNKSKTEKFITRFANWYTPAVVGVAVLLAIVPSLITGEWAVWVKKALIFLVVSCPCALVISVPMSFCGGIGGASKKGILIKGAEYLEKLSSAGTFIFDKTGTVTSGKFVTKNIVAAEGIGKEELLCMLLTAEKFSNHPISSSICEYCRENGAKELCGNGDCTAEELAGLGVSCEYGGHRIFAGNRRLAQMHTVDKIPETENTAVYVVYDGKFAGYAEVTDCVKENVPSAVAELKNLCNADTVMLSGDKASAVAEACRLSGIDRYEAELLPDGKLKAVEKIITENKGFTVYTGDGINDSPVLARSDVGVAMGSVGQDAAIEAADIVVMDDDIAKLPLAVKISRKTMSIVRQNIVFALGVKLAVLVFTVFGLSSMWLAVFADVGVSAIAILNAMRALRISER